MWKNVNDEIRVVSKETGNITEMKYSKVISEQLTYGYWDYLAWAVLMNKKTNPNILSIGHAAGTFNQLLNKWNVPCKGIGIEKDSEFKKINKKYKNIEIIYRDIMEIDFNFEKKFDALIIDVYDENGYFDFVYNKEFLKEMIDLKSENGVLLIHCTDFSANFLSYGLPIPNVKSVLNSMLLRLSKITSENIYCIPLWSTYLIWVGEKPTKDVKQMPEEIIWLDLYFKRQVIDVTALEIAQEELNLPWTYEKIIENQQKALSLLEELEQKRFLYYLKEMSEILSNKNNVSMINNFLEILESDTISNQFFLVNIKSYLHALKKDWDIAIKLLEE